MCLVCLEENVTKMCSLVETLFQLLSVWEIKVPLPFKNHFLTKTKKKHLNPLKVLNNHLLLGIFTPELGKEG